MGHHDRWSPRGDGSDNLILGAPAVAGALSGTSPGGGWRVGGDEAAAGQLVATNADGTPQIAATLTSGTATGPGVNKPGRRREDDVNLIAVARPVTTNARFDTSTETLVAQPTPAAVDLRNGTVAPDGPTMTLQAGKSGVDDPRLLDANAIPHLLAPKQNAPITFAQNTRSELRLQGGDGRIAGTLSAERGTNQQTYLVIPHTAGALDASDGGSDENSARAGHLVATEGDGQPFTFETRYLTRGGKAGGGPSGQLGALRSQTKAGDSTPLVVAHADVAATLNSGGNTGGFRTEPGEHLVIIGDETNGPAPASQAMGVRRLTPRECERLQGFPDDWTRYDAGGVEQSDSARYRQMGNAVAVVVAHWLGRRLAAVLPALLARREGGAP